MSVKMHVLFEETTQTMFRIPGIRFTVIALFLASQVVLASYAFARNNANLSRDQIRSMHILDRPSRPGHFYGNAVRRKHSREQSAPVRTNPASAWQGQPAYNGYYGGSYQTGETIIYGE
jgi:hypothetical protein